MLTILRKIRRSLIGKNSPSEYLLYALGEILLVVIGILIALQVNNWNEGRKEVIKEKELLSDLVKDLDQDLQLLNTQLSRAERIISSIDYLLAFPTESQELDEAIEISHGGTLVNYRTTAMRSIESYGINIIRNKDLSNAIIEYYANWDFGYELYRIDFDELHDRLWLPFFRKHMRLKDSNEPFKRAYIVRDYKHMIQNEAYEDLLVAKKLIFLAFLSRFRKSEEGAVNLKKQIEEYILS